MHKCFFKGQDFSEFISDSFCHFYVMYMNGFDKRKVIIIRKVLVNITITQIKII